MNLFEFFWDTAIHAGGSIMKLSLIIIPLMIVMQIMKDKLWLDRLTGILKPIGNKLGIREEGLFPLLVGILFGISYGSGVIIQSVESGEMNDKDKLLVAVFLVLCHAIVEDTMVFAAIGANGLILLVTRIVFAFLLTSGFSRLYNRKGRKVYGNKRISNSI